MKLKRFVSLLILSLLIASVALLKGCGGDAEDTQGCPDGSALAAGTDILVPVTGDLDHTSVFSPPSALFTTAPVLFRVWDQFARHKNNVCVVLYTDGIIWNKDYTMQLQDLNGRYVTETDETGAIYVYFSTPLLASSPATSSGGTVTAGDNQDYQFEVVASSGALQAVWTADVTVEGCPDTSFGSCP